MRYCLFNSVTCKQVDFASKQALFDWIVAHRSVLTNVMQRRWSVHRAGKPISSFLPFKRLDMLSTLHDFIVKHKLFE